MTPKRYAADSRPPSVITANDDAATGGRVRPMMDLPATSTSTASMQAPSVDGLQGPTCYDSVSDGAFGVAIRSPLGRHHIPDLHRENEAGQSERYAVAQPNRGCAAQQTVGDPNAGPAWSISSVTRLKSLALPVRHVFTTCGRKASVARGCWLPAEIFNAVHGASRCVRTAAVVRASTTLGCIFAQ